MTLEDPIADINDVNILFQNNVTRERAVKQPVAQTTLGGRRIQSRRKLGVSSQVVGFAANNRAQGSGVNTFDHLDKRRTVANLEADIETEFSVRAFADFHHL